MSEPAQRPATFRQVWAVGEFRALWAADMQSVAGDQLARVALSVLVFDRTGSAAWTAATYALTFLPDVLAGPLLGGLADRYPRRTVMVVMDLLRAAGVAVMAMPGLPLGVLATLLIAVQLCAAPFASARAALLPVILADDRYVVAQAMRQTSFQLAVVVGFAAGGAAVAAVGPSWALLINAVTFAVSAAVIWLGVGARPAATAAGGVGRHWTQLAAGAQLIWRDSRLRWLVAVAWLVGFALPAEGLAAPYVAQVDAGAGAVGVLLAAHAVGAAAGMLVIGRWCPPVWRLRLMGPLAVVMLVPLLGFAFAPEIPIAVLLLGLAGACGAYQIPAATTFMQLVPDRQRGQAFGLAGSGLKVAQGVGIVGGGLLATALESAALAIAVAAAAGLPVAIAAAAAWHRHARHVHREIT